MRKRTAGTRSRAINAALRARRWWLERGSAQCGHCLVWFHAEAAYRCAGCDGPACPACVVTVLAQRIVRCPDCKGEEAGS